MGMIIDLDIEKCVACGACAVACIDQNDTDTEYGNYRNVFHLEENSKEEVKHSYLSIACMHCEDAPCMKGCPSGCLSKDKETGFTVYDNSNCIGCHSCAMACPFGAPQFNKENKMTKCDGCVDRVKEGLKPACVKICPFFALKIYNKEEYKEVNLQKSLNSITKCL